MAAIQYMEYSILLKIASTCSIYFNAFAVKSFVVEAMLKKPISQRNFQMPPIFQNGHHRLYGNIVFCYEIANACPISTILVSNGPQGKIFEKKHYYPPGYFKMAAMEILHFITKSQSVLKILVSNRTILARLFVKYG